MFKRFFAKCAAVIAWCDPPALRNALPFTPEAELLRRSRLINFCCFISSPLVVLMFAIRFFAERGIYSPTIFVLLPLAFIIFMLPFVVRKTAAPKIGSTVIMLLTSAVICLRMYHTGGISSPIMMWMGSAVLWMSLIASWRLGTVTAIISIGTLTFLAYAERLGFPPPHASPPPLAQVAVSAIALLVLALVAAVFERQRLAYERQLQGQSKAIASEKAIAEDLNRLLSAMMDSVGQGFLIFDGSGLVAPSYSKACVSLLEISPAGRRIWEVISKSGTTTESLMMWLRLIFHSDHDFDNLRQLGPQTLINSKGRTIRLEYYPVFSNKKLVSVVMVATDITEEVRAKEQAVRDRAQSSMILKMVRNNTAFVQFNLAIDRLINNSLGHLQNVENHSEELLRSMHTLKGTANTLSMLDIAEQSHRIEGLILDALKKTGSDRAQTIQVVRQELETLRLLHKHVIRDFASVTGNQQSQQRHYRRVPEDQLRVFFNSLGKDSGQSLRQKFAKDFILVPAASYFNLIDDASKDIAERLYKQVKPVVINGGDYQIDMQPYLPLFETFVHAIRNAIDHGIELPSKRQDYGKDPAGQLTISFDPFQVSHRAWLRVTIADDGAGIDPKKVLKRAVELQVVKAGQRMSDDEIIQLIFHAGFSTSSTVTDISGRGVGLDAIKNEATRLGGRVFARSQLTKGSEIVIEIPEINPISESSKVPA